MKVNKKHEECDFNTFEWKASAIIERFLTSK